MNMATDINPEFTLEKHFNGIRIKTLDFEAMEKEESLLKSDKSKVKEKLT